MHRTVEVWPLSVWMHCPLFAFQTFRVLSVDPLTTTWPAICEDHTPPVCPTRVFKHFEQRKEKKYETKFSYMPSTVLI